MTDQAESVLAFVTYEEGAWIARTNRRFGGILLGTKPLEHEAPADTPWDELTDVRKELTARMRRGLIERGNLAPDGVVVLADGRESPAPG